jgi:nucleotide-binding universal stress UspA family protein
MMSPADVRHPVRILLAVDGSEHSQAALRLLCDLPLPPQSQVTAVSVIVPRHGRDRPLLEAALQQARILLGEKGVAVETFLGSGHPSETLIGLARQMDSDLIVMGARGRHAPWEILLGGTAQQVIEYAGAPVLMARVPYNGLRRILVAIDGSACSDQMVEHLAHFAIPSNADVRVIHVLPAMIELVPAPLPLYPTVGPVLPANEVRALKALYAQEERAGRKLLAQTVERLKSCGFRASGIFVCGDAAVEIIRWVRQLKVDLVVAASLGLSNVKEWLLGSVTRKLVYHAGCSILVIKAPST